MSAATLEPAMGLTLVCDRCKVGFATDRLKRYCPACVQHFRDVARNVRRHQNPPGMLLDLGPGVFKTEDCPKSLDNPNPPPDDLDCEFAENRICGCCGSIGIAQTYGPGSGFGFGAWSQCLADGCGIVQDFHPDSDDE